MVFILNSSGAYDSVQRGTCHTLHCPPWPRGAAAAAAAVRVRSSRLHHLSFPGRFLTPTSVSALVLPYLDDLTAFYSSHLVAKVVPGTSPVQHALGAAKPFFFADLGFCTTKQNGAFAGSQPAPVIDSGE